MGAFGASIKPSQNGWDLSETPQFFQVRTTVPRGASPYWPRRRGFGTATFLVSFRRHNRSPSAISRERAGDFRAIIEPPLAIGRCPQEGWRFGPCELPRTGRHGRLTHCSFRRVPLPVETPVAQ